MTAPFPVNTQTQVQIKTEPANLVAILPRSSPTATDDWSEILQRLRYCINSDRRLWSQGTPTHLAAQDRLLDGRQLQAIAEILHEFGLQLECIRTSRRQTAVAAATAGYSVQQEPPAQPLATRSEQPLPADPIYCKTTVRSGVTIRHNGSIIIWGDVNPGGEVVADGDILVWGGLRGVAHAGASGDRQCTIAALRLFPTQLRIADRVVRVPETPADYFEPEVAYLTQEGIRISPAANFARSQGRRFTK
jgi:septum site-determining protein MinC